jgi:hypothetical protein
VKLRGREVDGVWDERQSIHKDNDWDRGPRQLGIRPEYMYLVEMDRRHKSIRKTFSRSCLFIKSVNRNNIVRVATYLAATTMCREYTCTYGVVPYTEPLLSRGKSIAFQIRMAS